MGQRLEKIGLAVRRLFGSNFIDNEVEEIGSTLNRLWVESQDVDHTKRPSFNTVFGDKIIGTRVPTIAAQFQYGLRSDDATIDFVGSGTTLIDDSMLKLRTGTDVDGHIGIQGNDYLRYIPGHEAYAYFTAVFTAPAADSAQRIGLFDYDGGIGNGFFIGYENTDFCVTRRRSGTDYKTIINMSSLNLDLPFDPTKGNVFKISYGYLGFAPITFEILDSDGHWVVLHKIEYPNTSAVTHIANTNIPLRAEMTNKGNNTNLELRVGSVSAGVVDGGGSDPIARNFTFESPTQNITGLNQLFTFRNKNSYFGITNKISTQLTLLSASTEGNKTVSFSIYKNGTITTPGTNWQDISIDSVMEYATDEINTFGTGELLIGWKMAKADSLWEEVEKLLLKLRPNDYASIYVNSSSLNEVDLLMRWKELF